MAVDFDNFPFYDSLLKRGDDGKPTEKMSDVWRDSLATFFQTLIGYLSQNGLFVPQMTQNQINAVQSPVNGQMVYNTDANKFQGYENGSWINIA